MTKLQFYKAATGLLLVACAVLVGLVAHLWRQARRWRDSAIGNARKRLRKNLDHENEIGRINRNAAKEIARLNAELDALAAENRRLRNVNETYRKKVERRAGE